jgi:hypothetical protein
VIVRTYIHTTERGQLTLEKVGTEIDAHIAVPRGPLLTGNGVGNGGRLDLLEGGEDAVLGAEADDDLGHAEEEGLEPELEELAVEVFHVAVVAGADLG